MIKKAGAVWLFFAKILLFALIMGVFFAGQNYFYTQTVFYYWGNYIVLLLYAAVLFLTCGIYGAMLFGRAALQDIIISWGICLIITNVIEYFQLSLQALRLLPAGGFLIILAAQAAVVIPMAALINKFYYYVNPTHNAVIIYGEVEKALCYRDALSGQKRKFKSVQTLSGDEPLEKLLKGAETAGSVFFLDAGKEVQERLFDYCYRNNKRMYILPDFSNALLNTAEVMWFSGVPFLSPKPPELDAGARFAKRLVDITVSVAVIALFGWLMLLTAAAIRITAGKPVLYKQKRLTRDGKVFTLYKFRSMRPDAEADGVARLSPVGDERVTPVGRFIRRTRLDEFPQMFNVLRGDMSLVGPRPERPEIAAEYAKVFHRFAYRTKVKAGLTGFAQVYGRYGAAPDEKLFLDIMYIERFSIWLDIKLILQTIKLAFVTSGAEGVKGGGATAMPDGKKTE